MSPIIFNSEKAFKFLKDNGFVVTFRNKRRKNKSGKTDVRRKRTGKKKFPAYVTEITRIKDMISEYYGVFMYHKLLEKFAFCSGFENADRWIEEIEELNKGVVEEGYLYLVKKGD